MPEAIRLLRDCAFAPDVVKTMSTVFDEVWDSVAARFKGRSAQEIEAARATLAKAIVSFAGLGDTDPEVLKDKALRVLQYPR